MVEEQEGLRFCKKDISAFMPEVGWQQTRLPIVSGRVEFQCGRISPSITVMRSQCCLERAYDAVISHPSPKAMLVFVEKGCSRFEMPGKSVDVLPGDVWLMRADEETVRRHTPKGITAAMSAVRFEIGRVKEVLGEKEGRRFGVATRLGRNEALSSVLSGVLDNPLVSPLDRLLAEGQSLALLARWLGPPATAAPYASDVPRDDMRRLDRVIEMLTADLTAPPTLEAVAAASEMSHTRLNRCFRRAYGMTVFEWLRDYRLDRARHYLLNPKTTVTEVAFRCGFSSSSHFAVAFRERFRCSPVEFRRQTGSSAIDEGMFVG